MNLILDFLWLSVLIIFSYVEALVKLFVPRKRKSVSGEIVLITGAGHGIGRHTAYEFAKRQSKLVLWDINKESHWEVDYKHKGNWESSPFRKKALKWSGLTCAVKAVAADVVLTVISFKFTEWFETKQAVEATAEGCRRLGATAHAFVVDCSLKDEIYSAAEKVKRDIGDVSILVNNAGIVAAADLLSIQDKEIGKTFAVNILAHHWTTKAFLPAMMENNHGHIVTVASLGGHLTVPFLVSYCASKFAAVGFHKALTQELSALGKDGIQTTCLCPNFVNTGFIKHLSLRLLPLLEAEKVAEKLMDGILCNQKMIFLPPLVKVRLLFERILPERALVAMDNMLNVKFDAVVGYNMGKEH